MRLKDIEFGDIFVGLTEKKRSTEELGRDVTITSLKDLRSNRVE